MRPAAFFAGTLIALGVFIALAAVFAVSPAGIGVGILVISAIAAVSLVVGERQLPAR
jgi:hypothetical protein